MRHDATMSGWFRALFTAVMLFVCGVIAFCTVEQVGLRAQVEDLTRSLNTSRQRERKQQYEYDQVTAALPEAQAELEKTRPLAETAQATVTDLKAQRKQLRSEKAELETQLAQCLEEAKLAQEKQQALEAEVRALKNQKESLEQTLREEQ